MLGAGGFELLRTHRRRQPRRDPVPRWRSFDPTRFQQNPSSQFTAAGRILPFGAGMHYCAGSQLVRVEMRRGIEALMDRVDHAEFVDSAPSPVGFLLRSPATVDVVLTPAT